MTTSAETIKQVTIHSGQYSGKTISGTFEMIQPFTFWNNSQDRELQGKDGKIKVVIDGKTRGVWVNAEDCEYAEGAVKVREVLSDEEIRNKIRDRFNVMNKMGKGIISGVIRSLIISGAPGIGKTYSLERQLKVAEARKDITHEMVKGKISALGLYIKLFENRKPGSVIVLDDIDVFGDEDVLNILKAALDTGKDRWISWGTASSWLEEKDIPNSFLFEGSVVFITNTNIDRELDRNSKLTPHLDALVSRSIYLDLGVHSNRDIMIRVEDVISTTDMILDKGISKSDEVELVSWMKENVDKLRNVSLRTALFIADFIKTDAEDWRTIADVTLLKPVK